MAERILVVFERLGGSSEKLWHALGYSACEYETPIRPRDGEMVRFWSDSPSHVGTYRHARDLITPDPLVRPLPIYAPQTGRVICLVQDHDKFGDGAGFLPYTNYITVQAGQHEFYEICHIAKGSVQVGVGEVVHKGEQIAMTGVNGWMTDRRHCHILVGRWRGKIGGEFESLRIRFGGMGF
ncbi:hypothetical protein A2415_05340 [candidate division WWE3 bacterium RIFOXYC1_FULL_39_7]|uniref:Uncharacterized protein n=1 Tax=candidate division WWE3 bacterium RIFOXYC1_FULL_39_7 TaxID=1802643 RepID=A0A1F4WKW4_UNCKA|nr:MAG: hypothetical protein A2415_05340 [candidate division WWE3 bacterium RIFOXYC1_FULL_39_7]